MYKAWGFIQSALFIYFFFFLAEGPVVNSSELVRHIDILSTRGQRLKTPGSGG